MVSGPELAPNLAAAERLIAAAAAAGAKLAALPENFYIIGRHERDKVALREANGKGPIQDFLSQAAKRHRLWIIGGTAPIVSSSEDKIRSACLVYDDSGKRVARYDKSHLFRFESPTERHDESRTLEPGTGAVVVESPFGRLGLSICYDVRFPAHYQRNGAARRDLRALGVHRADRAGALGSAAARAGGGEHGLRGGAGAGRNAR